MIKQKRPVDCLPVAFQILTGIDLIPEMRETEVWHIQDIQRGAFFHDLTVIPYERKPKVLKNGEVIYCENFKNIVLSALVRWHRGIIVVEGHALAYSKGNCYDPATGYQIGIPTLDHIKAFWAIAEIESDSQKK